MQIAERSKLGQAWWVSSEFSRQNSRFKFAETRTTDGSNRGLETFDSRSVSSVFMYLNGSIHLTHGGNQTVEGVDWQHSSRTRSRTGR